MMLARAARSVPLRSCYRRAVHAAVRRVALYLLLACSLAEAGFAASRELPRVGYTLHWDFFATRAEAERVLAFALANGAQILNVVPPPHVWEQPESLALLRYIFRVCRAHGVGIVLNRIDGSALAEPKQERTNYLFSHVLTEPGQLPSGKPTPDFFLATVANPIYERWLEDEVAFYAANFSGEANLLGFGIGLSNEPFVSQRGSLLCFDFDTDSYEVGQYTQHVAALWRRELHRRFGDNLDRLNAYYRTHFGTFEEVPMPKSEGDPAFGAPATAYWDFVSTINAWVAGELDALRTLWHARRTRAVPFLLQFSGAVPEKFAMGRPAFAALNIVGWMERADALGLSLYTNCEYDDWGHSSVRAMVGLLLVGPLLGKQVFVLEGGNECGGAILDRGELGVFARAAAPLAPASLIYEFLRTTYYEGSRRTDGKLLDEKLHPNNVALEAVRAAFTQAKASRPRAAAVYVLNELGNPPDLALRRQLAELSLERPLTFVPSSAVARLPANTTLYVPRGMPLAAERKVLAERGIVVRPASELLTDDRRPQESSSSMNTAPGTGFSR